MHHLGVEVANPRHDEVVIPVVFVDGFAAINHNGAFYAFALPVRYHAKHEAVHGAGRFHLFVPEEFQLAPPVQVAIHVFKDLVQLGDTDKKPDRPILVIGKNDDARIHHRLHGLDEFMCRLPFHLLKTLVAGPGPVVHLQEIIRNLINRESFHIGNGDLVACQQDVGLAHIDLLGRPVHGAVVDELLVKSLKSIILKKVMVEGRVEIESVGGRVLKVVD